MDDMYAFERRLASEMRRRAGPSLTVDDAAVFDAVLAATTSHRWRVARMFTAAKLMVAGSLVALFGGILLVAGLPTQPSERAVPGAAASPSAPVAEVTEPAPTVEPLEATTSPEPSFVSHELTLLVSATDVPPGGWDAESLVAGVIDGSASIEVFDLDISPTRDIIVADRDINRGDTIRRQWLTSRSVLLDPSMAFAMTRPSRITGRVAAVDIPAHHPVTRNLLRADPESVQSPASSTALVPDLLYVTVAAADAPEGGWGANSLTTSIIDGSAEVHDRGSTFPTRDVVVSNRRIQRGETIGAESVTVIPVSVNESTESALTRPGAAVGAVAAIDILPYQPITSNLLRGDQRPNTAVEPFAFAAHRHHVHGAMRSWERRAAQGDSHTCPVQHSGAGREGVGLPGSGRIRRQRQCPRGTTVAGWLSQTSRASPTSALATGHVLGQERRPAVQSGEP